MRAPAGPNLSGMAGGWRCLVVCLAIFLVVFVEPAVDPLFKPVVSRGDAPRAQTPWEEGQAIYQAGMAGGAWRVIAGCVRLDTPDGAGEGSFASLAVAGDIVGTETLLFGAYAFSATALTHCVLMPWPEGAVAPAGNALLESFAVAQRRAAEVVALRGGQAMNRVLGLVRLLARESGAGYQLALPRRQDIADITSLRLETVSRILKSLERLGVLRPERRPGIHATRSFAVDFAPLSSSTPLSV